MTRTTLLALAAFSMSAPSLAASVLSYEDHSAPIAFQASPFDGTDLPSSDLEPSMDQQFVEDDILSKDPLRGIRPDDQWASPPETKGRVPLVR